MPRNKHLQNPTISSTKSSYPGLALLFPFLFFLCFCFFFRLGFFVFQGCLDCFLCLLLLFQSWKRNGCQEQEEDVSFTSKESISNRTGWFWEGRVRYQWTHLLKSVADHNHHIPSSKPSSTQPKNIKITKKNGWILHSIPDRCSIANGWIWWIQTFQPPTLYYNSYG